MVENHLTHPRAIVVAVIAMLGTPQVWSAEVTLPVEPACSAGYAQKGYACPKVIGPAPKCEQGYVGVPAMRIPVDVNKKTRDVPGFCVSQFMGDGSVKTNTYTPPDFSRTSSWFEAKAACDAIGVEPLMWMEETLRAQLMTESQWMALAHNIALVDKNWTGGMVDKGNLKGGEWKDDCFSIENNKWNGYIKPYTLCPQIDRKLILTNGAAVYDLAGPYEQWTYHDLNGSYTSRLAGSFGMLVRDQTAAPYNNLQRGMGFIPDERAGNPGYKLPFNEGYKDTGDFRLNSMPVRGMFGIFGLQAYQAFDPYYGTAEYGFRCTK